MKVFVYSIVKVLMIFVYVAIFMSCKQEDQVKDVVQDEISIYDKNGNPIAYSCFNVDFGHVIYLWNGKPTSYYDTDSESEIIGFNGSFLGWRESGIYYDLEGNRIGFEKGTLDIVTMKEPIKSLKEILPIKASQELKPSTPRFSTDWSSEELQVFFLKGRN